MNGKYLALSGRIRQELEELANVVRRTERIWEQAGRSSDDYYVDATALNLHGFYAGLERIFELIADGVDQAKPDGAHWHQNLLRQMSVEMPGVRPAVITPQSRDQLNKYRGFRHVVRNVYTYNLDAALIDLLVKQLPDVAAKTGQALLDFAALLEQIAAD